MEHCLLCVTAAAALACSVPGAAAAAPPSPKDDRMTVYRCTDATGRISLRDSPCRAGEWQETRGMLRPRDPPPRSEPPTARPPAGPPPEAPAREVIVVRTPQPMYECIAPDGERYTRDTPDGEARWVPAVGAVPVWAPGTEPHPPSPPVRWPGTRPRPGASGLYGRIGDRHGEVAITVGRPPVRHGPVWVLPVAGTWVRDPCHALPAEEVCDRLRDRRYELDRRYNSALQSERDAIVREQRGIDARLEIDCRGH